MSWHRILLTCILIISVVYNGLTWADDTAAPSAYIPLSATVSKPAPLPFTPITPSTVINPVPSTPAAALATAGASAAAIASVASDSSAAFAAVPIAKTAPICGPTPPKLSLQEAIFLALRYNPGVRNGEIQRVVDKYNLRVAQYQFELQYALTANANYTNTTSGGARSESNKFDIAPAFKYETPVGTKISLLLNNTLNHTASASTYYNPLATFVITQPLLRGAGQAVTLAPLYNAIDAEAIACLNLRNTIIGTITQVINQYTAVVQAENTLKSQELALATSLATVKQYMVQIKAGQSAPADIVQFQADAANQRLQVEASQIALEQARLSLLATLGLDPNSPFKVTDDVTMNDKDLPDLPHSIDLTLKNDIAYQTLKLTLREDQRALYVARDSQRPELDATVTQTFGGGTGGFPNSGLDSFTNGQNKSTNATLSLTVPINDVTLHQQLVNAKVAVEQQEIAVAAQKRLVIANAINAYNTLISQREQITQAKQALVLADLNLKNATIRLQYGRSTPFEVGTLQTALTNAQISLINTDVAYINALAAFEQTLGITLDRWCVQIRY